MRVEQFLVVGLVVSVAVAAAVSRPVTGLILRGRLDQLIEVAVRRIVIEEIVAGIEALLPEGRVLPAEPHVLDVGELGHLVRRVLHVRLVVVEQRGGGEHPHLGAQRTGGSAGETAGPLAHVGVGDVPDVTGLVDGADDQGVDELHGLHRGGAAAGERLSHTIGLAGEAESAEIAECVEITAGHDGIGFAAETALLVVRHVGHAVDVLDDLPAFAHGLVDGDTAAGIGVETTLGGIGELALEVTVVGILGVLGQRTRVVALDRAAPGDVAMVGIGERIDRRSVHHVTGSIGAIELSVSTPQEVAGVFRAREDGVDIHIDARRFLQEGVTDGELVDAGRNEQGSENSENQYFSRILFHGRICIRS